MSFRVTSRDVEQFRRELWKDERQFPKSETTCTFVKDCFSENLAKTEFFVLKLLSGSAGEALVPEPISVENSIICMQTANGMRLFEVLRALRSIELERRDGLANHAIAILMIRQRQRLAQIQSVLHANIGAIGSSTYPLKNKLTSLLSLLTRILGLQLGSEHKDQLSKFAEYWENDCALIPFRDATPKNTIVSHPELSQSRRLSNGEADRECISNILDKANKEWWESVPLLEIDFSSVEHLTTFEDDPISLHFHEWTFGTCPSEPTSLLLLPTIARVDPFRTAATFLVRYMRFGGRKLAYKLVNSQGFEIRFRYDDPLFYFRNLSSQIKKVSEKFFFEYEILLDLINSIGETTAHLQQSDAELLRVDYFRKHYKKGGDYWPENPMDL